MGPQEAGAQKCKCGPQSGLEIGWPHVERALLQRRWLIRVLNRMVDL